jgi:Zn-finger protein
MDEQDPKQICPICLCPFSVEGKPSLNQLVPRLNGRRNGPTARLHQINASKPKQAFRSLTGCNWPKVAFGQ